MAASQLQSWECDAGESVAASALHGEMARSEASRALIGPLRSMPEIEVLPARGFCTGRAEFDERVRADLDHWERDGIVAFIGRDGAREFPVTATEALAARQVFLRDRLLHFGPHEDAMLSGDRFMAHSFLSAPMSLGLLDPLECAYAAEDAGHIRQLIGWAGLCLACLLALRIRLSASQYLAGNRRMNQPLAGLRRLNDLDEVVDQQRRLGGHAP